MAEAEVQGKGLLRAAWRYRQFRFLLSSYGISGIGDFVYTVALVAYVYDHTGSPGWVGAAAIVRVIPYILFGTLGGTIAARFDRRRVMIISDLIRVGVMLAMAAAAFSDASAAVLIGLAFVNTTATTPWNPAAVASTPAVVGEDDLAAANAVEATVSQLCWFVGPALGAILFAVSSASTAFLVNGLTFAASAVLVAQVTAASSSTPRAETEVDAADDPPPDRGQTTSIWQLLRSKNGLILLTLLNAVVLLGYGFECVLYPLVADLRLGIGAEGAGYLIGAVGIGGLLIAPWSGRIAASTKVGGALALAAILLGMPLVLMSVITVPAIAVGVVILEGMGNIGFEVLSITMLQRLVRGGDLSRINGFHSASGCAAMVGGSFVAPILVNAIGLRPTLVIGGLALVGFGFAAAGPLTRLGVRLTKEAAPLADYVHVFARLGIFEGAGIAMLEQVARAVVVERRSPGEVIIREGDAPDDFYIVHEGTVEVSVNNSHLSTIGPEGWFGEIGLLRRIPRTATVKVATPAVLWRISGEAFGEAVAGLGSTPSVMEYEAGRRLALTMPVANRR